MVSSKCLSVESPSPLRSLAALMPPCAQTEWERLTGKIENRSTGPPASAILMTAASPASPPPITMILGAAMVKPFREAVDGGQRTERKATADPSTHHPQAEEYARGPVRSG